jgi:hypothetical protein
LAIRLLGYVNISHDLLKFQ